jgi:predicted outer membrane repeat protein
MTRSGLVVILFLASTAAPTAVIVASAAEVPAEVSTTAITVATWSELKTQCESGGEVFLSDSFAAGSYPGQIDISGKTCVVFGNGKVLDAGGAGRIFYGSDEATSSSGSLTIHNLVLKNGKGSDGGYSGHGGAIYIYGGLDVKIFSSEFINNQHSPVSGYIPQYGGAIYITDGSAPLRLRGSLQIYDSTFDGNTAGSGAAIYAANCVVEIRRTIFENNVNTQAGGSTTGTIEATMGYEFDTGTDMKIYISTFDTDNDVQRSSLSTVAFIGCYSDTDTVATVVTMTSEERLPSGIPSVPCPATVYATSTAGEDQDQPSGDILAPVIGGVCGVLVISGLAIAMVYRNQKNGEASRGRTQTEAEVDEAYGVGNQKPAQHELVNPVASVDEAATL